MNKYNNSIKLFIKIFFIALAIYLIFWHPLFVLLTLIIFAIVGYFIITKFSDVVEFFEDFFGK
jgi:hypothetical protein